MTTIIMTLMMTVMMVTTTTTTTMMMMIVHPARTYKCIHAHMSHYLLDTARKKSVKNSGVTIDTSFLYPVFGKSWLHTTTIAIAYFLCSLP